MQPDYLFNDVGDKNINDQAQGFISNLLFLLLTSPSENLPPP
jgi:hypothetical protein